MVREYFIRWVSEFGQIHEKKIYEWQIRCYVTQINKERGIIISIVLAEDIS